MYWGSAWSSRLGPKICYSTRTGRTADQIWEATNLFGHNVFEIQPVSTDSDNYCFQLLNYFGIRVLRLGHKV